MKRRVAEVDRPRDIQAPSLFETRTKTSTRLHVQGLFDTRSLIQCSSLGTPRLDLESRGRNLARVGMHRDIHSQPGEGTSYDPAREVKILAPLTSVKEQRKQEKSLRKGISRVEGGGIKLTACARLSVSSEALTPAFRSTLTRLIGWKRWSVSTKTPRWLVLRLSICLRKSSGHRSLQMNLMLSRGDWGRGRLALNLLLEQCQ
jgi:hypothetical protein